MKTRSVSVSVTVRMRSVLEPVSRAKTAASQLVERARIVLLSADGMENQAQADVLGVDRQRVRRWRHRWARSTDALEEAERALEAALEETTDKGKAARLVKEFDNRVLDVLADNERPGVPPKFSAEQMAQVVAVACEPPRDSGLPISHWTPTELAREVIKRSIVESISPRHVDRFLARRTCDRTRVSTG